MIVIAAAGNLSGLAAAASGSDFAALERKLGQALAVQEADPDWQVATYRQALDELEQVCGSRLRHTATSPRGEQFAEQANQLLNAAGRTRLEVLFLICPSSRMTATTLGGSIIVSEIWLSRATDGDLWAVAAHELAHGPGDFWRRIVIEHHLPGASAAERRELALRLEIRADCAAASLLTQAGVSSRVLVQFLKQAQSRTPGLEVPARLAVLLGRGQTSCQDYGSRTIPHMPVGLDFKDGKIYPNERPGLGVELDMTRLKQVGEWTQRVTARAQTHFRPDGSITNW